MSNRRVVVTGIGLVSSLGIGTSENWKALLAGRSGVETITKFDASQFATKIAGEVRGFDPLQFIEKKDVKKMDVFIQYAIAASQFAMDDAHLTIEPEHRDARRRLHRLGYWRVHDHRARAQGAARRRTPEDFPFLHSVRHHQLGGGPGLHSLRRKRAQFGDLHRLFGLRSRDWRRLRDHSAWSRGHHDRRWVGSRDYADGHRWIRRAARPVDTQRRAVSRQSSVRQGPRRLHRRRRIGRADSRDARWGAARGARIYAELVGTGCRPMPITSPRPPRTATARFAS